MVYDINHMHNDLLTKVEKHNHYDCDTQAVNSCKKDIVVFLLIKYPISR